MEVLIQGLEFTNRLQLLLLQNKNIFLLGDGHFEESAIDLTTKIFQSFTSALSLLNGSTTSTTANSVDAPGTSWDEIVIDQETLSPVITNTAGISLFDHGKSTGYSGDQSKNYKMKIPGSTTHDLKVGCKKRKTNSHPSVRVTQTPVDDGHAWRKYGQKVIYNTEFPRSYYRCTHRNEQGCEATKQVQKTQSKPSMYQTTYMGHHTCNETTSILDAIPDLMLDDQSDQYPNDSSCVVINFQTDLATKQSPYTFSSSSFNTSVKHELEVKHNTETHQHDYPLKNNITPNIDHDLTMSEFFLLDDLTAFDSISREVHEVLGV